MFYVYDRHLDKLYGDIPYVIDYKTLNKNVDIPCWSLTALLDIIPFCSLRRFVDGNWIVSAEFSFDGYRESLPNKSAVDACVEIILKLHEQIGEFSDGFHTFNGLYHQRMILFAVLVKTYKDKAWKSWKHEDGLDCFGGGWFIVGIDTPAGTYTYHYKAKDWSRFDCQSLEKAKHWDGHDETDVERLFTLIQPLEGKTAFDAIKEKKVDNANKVEPKFKTGNWICNGGGNPCKVNYIFCNYYELCSTEGYKYNKLVSDVDANYHLWSIEDAKDGDILCYKDEISLFEHDIKNCTEKGTTFGGFVYHCCYDGKRFMIDSLYSLTEQDKIDIHPATKEQRELLFKKMNDAWYEWDDENKILISM